MSWFDDNYTHRAAVAIANGNDSTVDVTIILPTDWPLFWDSVLSTGYDLRVVNSDGITALDFHRAAWNYSAKTGTINIDNATIGAVNGATVVWIYWGYASASDASSSFTLANTAKTGTIEVGTPGGGSQLLVKAQAQSAGATSPRTEITKASAEVLFLWWDLSSVLSRRTTPHEGSRLLEEIETATYDVITGQSSTLGAMGALSSIRVVHPFYVRTTIQAGASGTNYYSKLSVTTTGGRTLDFRVGIRVKDVIEPT